ncbi:MAG: NAD(P)H-dependent oxidoreductase [Bacteroidia bacterium]
MGTKKILVLLGHPNNSSLCAALASAYVEGATAAGAEVRVHKIGDMNFDPSLHLGYGAKQALEPDLERFQTDLKWSEHVVMVFPLWWGTMPGAMKGLIDRTFLPGVTFKYKEGSPFQDKLLAGRTGRVVMTMDSPNFWYKLVLGRPLTKAIKRQILGFCGIKPLKFTYFGNVRGSKPEGRSAWIEQMRSLGKAGA